MIKVNGIFQVNRTMLYLHTLIKLLYSGLSRGCLAEIANSIEVLNLPSNQLPRWLSSLSSWNKI